MTSRFVSAGSTDDTVPRTDDWDQGKKDVEEARRRKEEESRQEGGKSLYEILQQNKAAKQEAFEESIRLKNQFRSLDEDEVEFLDSVLESTRAQESALKKETQEQLEIFRKQQEKADRTLLLDENEEKKGEGAAPEGSEEQWKTTGRKRRRVAEKDGLKGIKLRKSSSTSDAPAGKRQDNGQQKIESGAQQRSPEADLGKVKSPAAEAATNVDRAAASTAASQQSSSKGLLNLDYGSDEDD